MKKFLCLAASVALLTACGEKPGYEIAGSVSDAGLNGEYIYLYNYAPKASDRTAPIDSALVQNGNFTFKGTVASPTLSQLIVPADNETVGNATFILENAKLTASMGVASTVRGTVANDEYNAVSSDIAQVYEQMEKLEPSLKSEDKNAVEEAQKQYDQLDAEANEKAKAFIESGTSRQLAAVLFYDMRYSLSEEERNAIVDKADSTFKAVPGIDKMIEHLNVLKNSAVGKKFIDFEMADPDGKMHKLSEFVGNGKVVLIDFWASWCPPCRRDMPNLVEAYKKYKSKGFEIVGISLDSKADAWAKGVKDLNITWTQLSDLQGWKNAGAQLYGVNSIPSTVLVDKDGTIIAKGLHGTGIATKLEEILK